MIVIFPMLTSNSASGNVLPGVCKMLEKYILVHQIDKVLSNAKFTSDVVHHGSSLRMKSGIMEQSPSMGIKPKTPAGISVQIGGKPESKPKGIESPPNIQQALALEPTWVKIEMKDGWTVLGIKVVPFPVQSDENVIKLMMKDLQMSFWKRTLTKFQRLAMRFAFRQMRVMSKLVNYKGGAITGDPEKDILFAQSQHKQNVFTLINMIDLQDAEGFLKDAGGVKRLYSMGWKSFVILDDVRRQAHFCLEDFGGMCSMIPYNFIYSSLGKEHNQVYENLEDVRKSGSAFFRMKTRVNKVFGESEDSPKNMDIITEDFVETANKLKPAIGSVFRGLDVASKSKDKKKDLMLKALSKIPNISPDRIESICKRLSPDFSKNYDLTKRVLTNSLTAPDPVIVACSMILAFGSSYKNDGDTKATTIQAAKMFIQTARKQPGNTLGEQAGSVPQWKLPSADPKAAPKYADDFIKWTTDWIATAYYTIGAVFKGIKKLNIDKAQTKTIGSVFKEAYTWCREHDLLLAIILVFLAFLLLAYLTRNS